jgi:hypothetical protein
MKLFIYGSILIIFILTCCESGNKNRRNAKIAEQSLDTANPLNDMRESEIKKEIKKEELADDDTLSMFENFEKIKKKSKKDFDGFFYLLLNSYLSDLGENMGFYLENELHNKTELRNILYYASINKDSARLNESLSSEFCNIYFMQDENYKKQALKAIIEKDFSFASENAKTIHPGFVNNLKKNI